MRGSWILGVMLVGCHSPEIGSYSRSDSAARSVGGSGVQLDGAHRRFRRTIGRVDHPTTARLLAGFAQMFGGGRIEISHPYTVPLHCRAPPPPPWRKPVVAHLHFDEAVVNRLQSRAREYNRAIHKGAQLRGL